MSIFTDTLQQEIDEAFKYPLKVMAIFQDYYGQDHVDMEWFDPEYVMQALLSMEEDLDGNPMEINGFAGLSEVALHDMFPDGILHKALSYLGLDKMPGIIVHLPIVKVTNEFNESSIIRDVFVRMIVTTSGELDGVFKVTRSTFTVSELVHGYIHPHVRLFDAMPSYNPPCLGRGPLINTIPALNSAFDEDMWRLFCVQLHEFLQTESISGGPYLRQNAVTLAHNRDRFYNDKALLVKDFAEILSHEGLIIEFVSWLIDHADIKFGYSGGSFRLGMTIDEFGLLISNLYIQWINTTDNWRDVADESCVRGVLLPCIKHKGMFSLIRKKIEVQGINERVMFIFRGDLVKVSVVDAAEERCVLLLQPDIVSRILHTFLNIINITYGTEYNKKGISSI